MFGWKGGAEEVEGLTRHVNWIKEMENDTDVERSRELVQSEISQRKN